jgi:hypothetical protein
MLIIEYIPIAKHIPIFISFINQIERFLCNWMCKLGRTLNIRNKGATQFDSNVFEKIILDFSLI